MITCHNCQHANPDGSKFCNNCGQSLSVSCPRCSAGNPPGARFCNNCGQSLQAPVAAPATPPAVSTQAASIPPPQPAQQSPIDRYLPAELRTKLERARASGEMAGERRVVTMLFCDVKGSTGMAERLDPEDWSEIINGAFAHMIRPVYRYEGTVARLMGDGLLAFFGAPIAHEDDPQRAVLAGLEIVAGIQGYRQEVHRRWNADLDVRVGINTGLVVVGEVGSDLRMEYSALGDAINLAARMEQSAAAGTVQVAEETYRLATGAFEWEGPTQVQARGRQEAVRAYRALRLQPMIGRGRELAEIEVPFVGRERESAALRGALDRLRQGVGGIVCLLGEVGLGKTRLAWEMGKVWDEMQGGGKGDAGGGRWVECTPASYEADRPYSQAQQLLRQLAGILPAEETQTVQAKLEAFVSAGEFSRPELATQLLQFLLDAGREDNPVYLQGDSLKQELIEVVRQVLQNWVGRRPAVILFDDLQWADSASVALLYDLFRLSDYHPVLFLCLFRPDRDAEAWSLKTRAETEYPHRYVEIVLEPLPEDDSRALVSHLLKNAGLAVELLEPILHKAEGNPFFAEEVVRSLKDAREGNVLQPEPGPPLTSISAIPGSLQALLTARIDRLDERARGVLQTASVVGRRFQYKVLDRIHRDTLEVDREVAALLRADLIREAARLPDLEYLFRHTLFQEVAYRSILRRHRRELHRQVGDALEQIFSDRLESVATQLAHHFDQAGDARAATYYRMAGDVAFRLYATAEAVGHFSRALTLLRSDQEASDDDLIHLYTQRGRAHELSGRFEQALANYRELEELGVQRQNQRLELAALMLQCVVHSIPTALFDAGKVEALAGRAYELALVLGDRAAEARILWTRMNIDRFSPGRTSGNAIALGEQAEALARDLGLQEQLAFILNDLVDVYASAGKLRQATETSVEVIHLWRELGNLPMLADSLGASSLVATLTGDYPAALAFSEEALEISRSINNTWGLSFGQMMTGAVYWDLGQPSKALQVMAESIHYSSVSGFVVPQAYVRAYRAMLYLDVGALDLALADAVAATEVAELHFPQLLGVIRTVQATVHIARDELDQAAAILAANEPGAAQWDMAQMLFGAYAQALLHLARGEYQQALDVTARYLKAHKRTGIAHLIADLYHVRATVLRQLGQIDAAKEALRSALEQAETLESKRILWRLLRDLAEIEEQDGSDGGSLRQRAAQIVTEISANIDDEGLRAGFLRQPEVRALLDSQTLPLRRDR